MKKIFIIVFLLITSFVNSKEVYAHYHGAYSSDSFIDYQNSGWMSNITDETKLSEISIPGTHDSMSNGPGGDIARTQSLSLPNQLSAGIRYLDIRVRATNGVFAIHHGPIYLNVNFGNVLNDSIDFLNRNPSETILMRVKQEHLPVSWNEFNRILDSYLSNNCYSKYFSTPRTDNPTLGELRGKILILRDFNGGSVGISYKTFEIQDNYHMNTNWDLYKKWESIKQHINYSSSLDSGKKAINYLSASGGSFPYFVASGHSSPGTSAPRLATGLTHPGWAGSYPDFPRVNWFLGIATIAFEGTNILTQEYLKNHSFSYVGVIVADFPGKDLINEIIISNYRRTKIREESSINLIALQNTSKNISHDNNSIFVSSKKNNALQDFVLSRAIHKGENIYQIWNHDKSKLIAWNKGKGENSREVFMHPNEDKDEHYWCFEYQKDGTFIISNYADANLVIDVNKADFSDGTSIIAWPRNGNANQKFFVN